MNENIFLKLRNLFHQITHVWIRRSGLKIGTKWEVLMEFPPLSLAQLTHTFIYVCVHVCSCVCAYIHTYFCISENAFIAIVVCSFCLAWAFRRTTLAPINIWFSVYFVCFIVQISIELTQSTLFEFFVC